VQIEDLARLLVVHDLGQVTDAAAALKMTQSTLSRAISRVEADLGVRLFERDAKGLRANPYGHLVIAAAGEITDRYEELRRQLTDLLDPDSGTVRLAFLDSMATSVVPHLLRGFRDEAPHVGVVLRQEPNHEILADLDRGVSEVAITSPRPPGTYGWVPLQTQRLALVVPAGHELAGRRRARLSDLRDEDLVTVPKGFGFRTLVDELCAAAGVSPRVAFEIGDLATIEGIVGSGLGVAVLPEGFAGTSGTVGLPLAAAGAERTVGLTWRSDRALAPAAARFLAFVRRAAPVEEADRM
jgi:DNA-binding transcriptional LysR family regulator